MKLEKDHVSDFLDQCFSAGIKNPHGFLISKMPQIYGWLKGAFPRGILPTDIDGEVEINSFFLRLEFKHESSIRNGRIPVGQRIALEALLKTGRFTVVLIGTDDRGMPTCRETWTSLGKRSKLIECDYDSLREHFSKWADWAGSQKEPSQVDSVKAKFMSLSPSQAIEFDNWRKTYDES